MNKRISLLIVGFFLTLFLTSMVSAFDWSGIDNYKEFIQGGKYGTIEIWDSATTILFQSEDKKLAEYKLIDNTDQCLIDCYTEGTATLYEDGKLFSDLNFKDRKGDSVYLKESKILLWTTEEYEVEINDYKEVCEDSYNLKNDTTYKICSDELIGTHKETRERASWKGYNYETLDAGNYKWRIEGKKNINQKVDWVGTSFGKELNEWAWWNNNWAKRKEITIEGGNSDLTNFTVFINVSFDSDMNTDFSDLRFINGSCSGVQNLELDHEIEGVIASNVAWVWLRILDIPSTGTTVCMYYENSGASSTSNPKDTWDDGFQYVYHSGQSGTNVNNSILNKQNMTLNSLSFSNLGAFGYGIEHDGVANHDASGGFDSITGDITILGWVNSSSPAETKFLANVWSPASNNREWFLSKTSADKILTILSVDGSADSVTITSSTSIPNNQWSQYGLKKNATGTYLYISGNRDATSGASTGIFDSSSALRVGSQEGASNVLSGFTDELLIYSGDLPDDWIKRSSENINLSKVVFGSEEDNVGIDIVQSFPVNYFNTTDNTVGIGCNFTGTGGENITDVTVLVYNSSDNLDYTDIESGLNLKSYNKTWTTTILTDDIYLWACFGEGITTEKYTGNRTFTVDTTVPIINIISPTGTINYHLTGTNLTLNWSVSDSFLESCWYNYNSTNISVICSDNSTQFTVTESSNKNLTFYANDSLGNENSNFTGWIYKFFENSKIFNNLSYETDTETFILNLSSEGLETTSATFSYGGVNYSSTKTGDNFEMLFTGTNTPSTNATNYFYWSLNYGLDVITSTTFNQTVSNTEFNICNVSDAFLNTTFLNITFLDEETLTRIGAQIDTSTTTYWLGDGSVTENLIYSNLTNMSEYDFCFTPASRTMQNTREIQYSATGYPQRKYDDDTDLTSTTTHKTLYLLSSADGIYSTIQVVDENGDIVTGADVTMERQFSGVWTIIGKETSDGAGAVTFWVNPDYDHRFTLEKTGCVTTTGTIRPTQTTYTATLDCLGVSDEVYVAPIEGIKYFILPGSGIITTGQQNFSFQVVSTKDNIAGVKFEIVNSSGSILTSETSACAVDGCTISKLYTITSVDNLWGRYYVDLGDGYILLEADAHWIEVNITARDGTFKQFWLNLRTVFDEWHEEGEDVSNTSDFNRIVFIFLFLAIGIAVFNRLTHFDSSNPGAFLIFLTAVVFMGSIAGVVQSGTDVPGFFYLDNFGVSYFVNNYIILGYMLLITITHYVGVQLQKNR